MASLSGNNRTTYIPRYLGNMHGSAACSILQCVSVRCNYCCFKLVASHTALHALQAASSLLFMADDMYMHFGIPPFFQIGNLRILGIEVQYP